MTVDARSPAEWPKEILAEFETLVRAGGQVAIQGLSARIADAHSLACHFENGRLVATSALKKPHPSYRERLSKRSGFDLNQSTHPYEVGWVYVLPDHRGLGLSRPLVEACLAAIGHIGVFATTRTDNMAMRCTLKRCGFVEAGNVYKSNHGDASLQLFVRQISSTQSGTR